MSRLKVNLSTAWAYAATGWLSLQLAIAPEYVSLFFVPAGIALAVLMVYGHMALPGVFLGSLAVQWMASHQAGFSGWSWTMLVGPTGALVQAAAGAWLARRWVGFPDPLDSPQHVIRMLVGVIPLSTLINASLSVPVLVGAGVLPASEAIFSWSIWWLGDALGAGLALPIALVLIGQPAGQWRPRRKALIVPMALATTLIVLGIFQTNAWDKQQLERRFMNRVSQISGQVQRRLDAQNDSMQAVASLLAVHDNISAQDFKATVLPWLDRYPGTQNFGWSPLVSHAQRDDFVAQARQRGLSDFAIRGRDITGKTYEVEARSEYLPITLVEPLAQNRNVLGLDVQVLAATAEAVKATLADGLPHVTEGIRLVQEKGEQRGVVLYQSVHHHREPTRLKGVASSVFRMDDVLTAALGTSQREGLVLCLVDTAATAGNQRLAGPQGCEAGSWLGHGLQALEKLDFGGRRWEIRLRPNESFALAARNWSTWVLIATGLVSVSLLGAFLLVVTGQSRRTQSLVHLRTAELAQSNADLRHLSEIDTLTGLPNRSHLISQTKAAMHTAKMRRECVALIFLDLDQFKHVNDTLGHAVGDKLLQAVAQKIPTCLRQDDVLARLGGDEFVVLLPHLKQLEDATPVVEKIVRLLSQPISFDGHEATVTVSAGLAGCATGLTDIDTLLRQADTAMYAAKSSGRNGWSRYSPVMDLKLSERMFIENGLRRALERRELYLVYQPQIDGNTGRVLGVEALLRWESAERGPIGPDVFIAVAEDCGLIEPIGLWVLQQACAQQVAWREQGIADLQMAVNISALQFQRPTFLSSVRDVLHSTGINPALLELEITESLLMHPLQDIHNRLNELTQMGVSLALDDFGTGYSNLGYLKRLPLAQLKIDRSFVAGLPDDLEDRAITRATLSMARDLGLSVVAEGVETAAQRDYLLAHGCTIMQGWLYAKPMRGEDFASWHAGHAARHSGAL